MSKNQSTYRNYTWQHRLIGFFRNIDLPGFRKLSLLLPKWLLPDADKVGEHILKLPNGVQLWIDPSQDKGVERSLYETGTYERGTLHFMQNHLKTGDTFVDVGANIGLMSINAKIAVGENGQVWAFEANPKTFEILEKNLELNDQNSVHTFACGLGEKKGTLILYHNWSINRGAASTIVKEKNAQTSEITILTLDEVAIGQSIAVNMLKIDVEGMEWEVLEGARKTIENCRPILIIEFSAERKAGKSRKELYKKLTTYDNYFLFKLAGGKERSSKLIAVNTFAELPIDDNIFCIPSEKIKI